MYTQIIWTTVVSLLLLHSHAHPFPRTLKTPTNTTEPVVIYMGHGSWAGFFNLVLKEPNYLGRDVIKPQCPVECRWTNVKEDMLIADAILMEGQTLIGFTDTYKRVPLQFAHKQVNQKWINFGYETPIYFPILAEPAFHIHIDINMTYNQRDDVPVTFMCDWGGGEGLDEYKKPPKNRTKGIAYMASNCFAGGASARTAYAKILMEHIPVDSFGECLKNTELPEEMRDPVYSNHGLSMRNKIKILSNYKFVLTFENTNITDYVTEKLPSVFKAGAIPVYMGAPNIDDWMPGNHSIIKTDDFGGPAMLAKYLKYLLENKEEYEKYFEWKKYPFSPQFQEKWDRCVFYDAGCRLCQHMHALKKRDGPVVQSGKNMVLRIAPTGGYFTVQNSKETKLFSQYTFASWIFVEEVYGESARLIDRNTKGTVDGFFVDVIKKNRIFLRLCAAMKCMVGIRPVRKREWIHVAITFDSTKVDGITLYVNGQLDSIHDSYMSHTENPGHDIVVGATTKPFGNDQFDGLVDELSLWNRTLTHEEIRKLQFQHLAGDEIGLVIYYPIDSDDTNDIVYDHTGLHHGKTEGMVEYLTSQNKPLYVSEFD